MLKKRKRTMLLAATAVAHASLLAACSSSTEPLCTGFCGEHNNPDADVSDDSSTQFNDAVVSFGDAATDAGPEGGGDASVGDGASDASNDVNEDHE